MGRDQKEIEKVKRVQREVELSEKQVVEFKEAWIEDGPVKQYASSGKQAII